MESLRALSVHIGPTLLLIATLIGLGFLQTNLQHNKPMIGFTQGDQETISSLETGRILLMAVEPGQEVTRGQLIARLDPSLLDAEIAVLDAERLQLMAQLEATRADSSRQLHLDSRALADSVDSARIALVKEEAALEQARAKEAALKEELDRLSRLVEKKLATADDLTRVKVEYAESAKEVEERPRNIEALKSRLENAAAHQQNAPSAYATASAAPFVRALEVTNRRLELLRERRGGLELTAPDGGRILTVLKRTGEVAMPGEILATLVHTRASRVVACLSEQEALDVRLGDSASVSPRGRSGAPVSGIAVALGPIVDEVPLRCRKFATVPAWGREVVIQLDQPLQSIPGEAFDVRLERTSGERAAAVQSVGALTGPSAVGQAGVGNATPQTPNGDVSASAASASQAAGAPADPEREALLASAPSLDVSKHLDRSNTVAARAPSGTTPRRIGLSDVQRMGLPPDFSSQFNLEPSGWVWWPERARYLTVSDDPGSVEGGKHRPVLFAVDQRGQVDASPLRVEGIQALDDLESIVAVGSGFYVLSSQSENRKGNLKPERTAFLKLQPTADGLVVAGQVSFAGAIDAQGPALWQQLGLEDIRSREALNIEGMAWYQNALYLGLKAPQGRMRQSLIWKLTEPDALLSSGQLKPGQLSLYAQVALTAEVDGQEVVGGISELLFLPDGRLLVTATPSQTKEGRQSGALYIVADPMVSDYTGSDHTRSSSTGSEAAAGGMQAVAAIRFDGLKPEALSLAPTPGFVAIAFDTGGVDPSFVEIPWSSF